MSANTRITGNRECWWSVNYIVITRYRDLWAEILKDFETIPEELQPSFFPDIYICCSVDLRSFDRNVSLQISHVGNRVCKFLPRLTNYPNRIGVN